MLRSLVGSEMCIRDRAHDRKPALVSLKGQALPSTQCAPRRTVVGRPSRRMSVGRASSPAEHPRRPGWAPWGWGRLRRPQRSQPEGPGRRQSRSLRASHPLAAWLLALLAAHPRRRLQAARFVTRAATRTAKGSEWVCVPKSVGTRQAAAPGQRQALAAGGRRRNWSRHTREVGRRCCMLTTAARLTGEAAGAAAARRPGAEEPGRVRALWQSRA